MKTIKSLNELDLSKISNIKFDGLDNNDYPDFCDAYIVSADYDGHELDDFAISLLNEDKQFVHEQLFDFLY